MTQNNDKKQNKADQVYNYTASKLNYLHSKSDSGPGKALMAIIRRGVSRKPGELPELWGLMFDGMPEELLGKKSTSYAEWAVYTALTLYALHQQGHQDEKKDERNNWMYVKNVSLGKAAAMLAKQEKDEERILNRMNLVVTALSPYDLAYHLRAIVQLLSRESIGLDYARLAKELYLMNNNEIANNIKLAWGRDFYSNYIPDNSEANNTNKTEKENKNVQ